MALFGDMVMALPSRRLVREQGDNDITLLDQLRDVGVHEGRLTGITLVSADQQDSRWTLATTSIIFRELECYLVLGLGGFLASLLLTVERSFAIWNETVLSALALQHEHLGVQGGVRYDYDCADVHLLHLTQHQ